MPSVALLLTLVWGLGGVTLRAQAQTPATRVIDARQVQPPAPASAAPPAEAVDARVEGAIKAFTLYLARFVEGAAALVIGVASARGLWGYVVDVARGEAKAVPKEEIRLSLGRSLALALEFELGADILKTAVAPTWNDIGLLGAIAFIRTALNYFLEQELRNAEKRDPRAATAPVTGTPEARSA